jgi:hypothetical protein
MRNPPTSCQAFFWVFCCLGGSCDMGSLAGSIRAWDGRTRTSTDEHGQTGDGVWHFAPLPARLRWHSSVLSPQSSVLSPFYLPLPAGLRWHSSVLSPQSSVLSPQSSALSTFFSVLSPQHSALSTFFSVLSTQHFLLSPQPSALSTQHFLLSPQSFLPPPSRRTALAVLQELPDVRR